MENERRISYMQQAVPYYFTASIHNWQKLFFNENAAQIVLDSLSFLSDKNLIRVFGFVIMPTHIHMILSILKKNGKESPQGSFLKFTSHEFKKLLQKEDPKGLGNFYIGGSNKRYEFWQRDPYAFELEKIETAFQKLNYMHMNPVSKKWNLCEHYLQYKYSSARFYESGIDEFGFLHHIREAL